MTASPPRRRVGRGRRMAAAASGLLILGGGCGIWWSLGHQLSAPQAPVAAGAVATQRHVAPSAAGAPQAGAGGAARDTAGARRPLGRSRPVRVVIPSIEVRSSLQELGANPDGTLEVPAPPHYDEAGWYTGSPTPGQVGPAVILGHVDGVGTTPSVFFELGALRSGDRVEVTRSDGRVATFTVYRVLRYPKDDFPTRSVYGHTDAPELRLITCGGTVDPQTGHYHDNTVVYARMTHVTARGDV